jgi:radical SAM protein with 4Fe4S-binding SPASM domain
LPEDEGVGLEAADRATADEWAEQALKGAEAADHGNFYCRAGRAAFVIDASGAMNVCSLLPRPGARPLEAGFARAWDQLVRYVEDAPPASAECRSCDAAAYCGRCPAWSLTETGTLTEPAPYLCRVARARKARYGPR